MDNRTPGFFRQYSSKTFRRKCVEKVLKLELFESNPIPWQDTNV